MAKIWLVWLLDFVIIVYRKAVTMAYWMNHYRVHARCWKAMYRAATMWRWSSEIQRALSYSKYLLVELFLLLPKIIDWSLINYKIVYSNTDQWSSNCGTSLSTISKMVHPFIRSMNVNGNLLALNWKDVTWENFGVLEISSCLVAAEPLI